MTNKLENLINELKKSGVIDELQTLINIAGNPPVDELGALAVKAVVVAEMATNKKLEKTVIITAIDMVMDMVWRELKLKRVEEEDPCKGCHGCDEDEDEDGEQMHMEYVELDSQEAVNELRKLFTKMNKGGK